MRSSESWSPSFVVQVTAEPTRPGEDGTLMITVAESLAPFGSLPNEHAASVADVVHDPAETTLTTAKPGGAGASSCAFGSDRDVPFVKVVR